MVTTSDSTSDVPWTEPELEAILDALPARVTWWDARLHLLYANAGAVRASGRTRAEMLGRRLDELLTDGWVKENAEALDRALAGEAQQLTRTATEDGEERHFEVHLVPTGEGLVVFSVESTSLVLAQEQAREHAARAALLSERQRIAAELGGLVLDRLPSATADLSRSLDTAPELCRLLRESATRCLDDVIAALRSTIRSLGAPREPDATAPAGAPSTHSLSSRPETAAAESRGAGLAVDELLLVLDALPAAVTAFDARYVNTFANRFAVALYRFGSREAVHGKHGVELLGQAAYDASVPYGDAAMAGEAQQFVRTMPAADGPRSAQVDYVAQVVDGVPVGAVALVHDVTARVRAEDEARDGAEQVAVLSDRARIAEDLHDLVIQRLFAAGLMVRSPGVDVDGIQQAIECIEDAVEEMRVSIHELRGRSGEFHLDDALARVVRQATRPLGFSPEVRLETPPDGIDTALAVDVVAVVSEALANAAKHARPRRVDVRVSVTEGDVLVRVADDGTGPGVNGSLRRSGLANLTARALRHGGTCTWRPNEPHGTVVEWTVPLPRPAD